MSLAEATRKNCRGSRTQEPLPFPSVADLDEGLGSFTRNYHCMIPLPHLLMLESSRKPRGQSRWPHNTRVRRFSDLARWGRYRVCSPSGLSCRFITKHFIQKNGNDHHAKHIHCFTDLDQSWDVSVGGHSKSAVAKRSSFLQENNREIEKRLENGKTQIRPI